MAVQCPNCGAQVMQAKFCSECGAILPAEVPINYQAAFAPVPQQEQQKKEKKGFFYSPGGIALVAIIGVAVLAGIAFGIILLVRNPNSKVDAETVKVWDEYESMLEDESGSLPKITMDQNALTQAQADLKKSQEKAAALEKVLKETGGTQARKTGKSGRSKRDVKADELAASLAAYKLYVQKMNELFTTLIGANLLDPNVVNKLNQILAELQKLGANVKVTANKFLDNNTEVVTVKIDLPLFKIAETWTADVQANVTAAQQAEQQRLATEQAAAEQAAQQAAAAAAAQQAAEEAAQQAAEEEEYLDASRCPNGDPYCPI